jgi:hypothetical protein
MGNCHFQEKWAIPHVEPVAKTLLTLSGNNQFGHDEQARPTGHPSERGAGCYTAVRIGPDTPVIR